MNNIYTDSKILLIIPCYNEADSICILLKEIQSSLPGNFHTIVIDDGSIDNTAALASTLSPTIRLLRNLGIGGAVHTGIKYALVNDFDFCIQVDGDGQHPPQEVFKLLDGYQETKRSIIVGSRYIKNNSYRSTRSRRFGSKIISTVISILFQGVKISDPTSGMRLMDRKAIKLFSSSYPHDYPEPISLAWALQSHLSIGETPVSMRARESGASSIFGIKTIAYMCRVLGYILLARFFYVSNDRRS